MRTTIIRLFAQYRMRQIYRQASQAIAIQEALLPKLINRARNTKFGRDHGFSQVQNHHHFTAHVPIRDYEGLRSYVEEVVQGIPDVLWPGLPTYLAKTSGTTSGTKYIPMTKESTPHHVRSARDSLFAYVNRTGKADFFAHKMVYLSGSPELSKTNGILTGRLSGIVNHQIPAWIKGNKLPSRSVNVIEDWEQKVAAMVEEARDQDISLIGGIPPWVQMFYEELLRKTSKDQVLDVFPNFQVFVYGGVNFAPYRQKLDELVGRGLDVIETYPASEGFLAFQDSTEDKGLLLNTNAGIFFEFVPSSEISNQNPKRLTLAEVEVGVNYAVILTTNAGLWA
ncbi:MAG: GH3 auxin-responsive promoter family protein, partial [Saprospiraceae bacterium]|nr:GH3 auxin-responsive promoter family protein [Saprospiraceae bacterium]